MKTQFKSNLTDLPLNKQEKQEDKLEIKKYSDALESFISNIQPPITIALQGEWGSGKTSMMKTLQFNLCFEDNNEFHSVWINTWHYSLLSDKITTIEKILQSIISQVLANDEKFIKNDKLKKKWDLAKNIGFGAISKTVSILTSGNVNLDDFDEIIKDKDNNKSTFEIEELKKNLTTIVDNILKTTNKSGILFFIDDLDRIDPPLAVEILELLKNIFDIPGCIFILAIDYEVVIKGLKPKFGELTKSNEREFRSFFDKIIQVPFTMPVSSYQINDFLKESLENIGFIDSNFDDKSMKKLTNIANLSVGTNPRSLKRLINILSLLNTISKSDEEKNSTDNKDSNNNEIVEDKNKEIIIKFALICIQITYPFIYKCITQENDFLNWNISILSKNQIELLSDEKKSKIGKEEEFDEEWEQTLYTLCTVDSFLLNNAFNISKILNILKSLYPNDSGLKDKIEEIVQVSNSTFVNEDNVKQSNTLISLNAGDFLRNYRNSIIPVLNKELSKVEMSAYVKQSKIISRIETLIDKNNIRYNLFKTSVYSSKENLITVRSFLELYALIPIKSKTDYNLSINGLENQILKEKFKKTINDFEQLIKDESDNMFILWFDPTETHYKAHTFLFGIDFISDDPYILFKNEDLKSKYIHKIFKINNLLKDIKVLRDNQYHNQ